MPFCTYCFIESNQSGSYRLTPQPQQHQIQATSVTYTEACGNARSLIHWARPGIKPESSKMLCGFLTHWGTTGTPGILVYAPRGCVVACKEEEHTSAQFIISLPSCTTSSPKHLQTQNQMERHRLLSSATCWYLVFELPGDRFWCTLCNEFGKAANRQVSSFF